MKRIFAVVICVAGAVCMCQACAFWTKENAAPDPAVFMISSPPEAPGSITQTGNKSPRTVYLKLYIRSEPDEATIKINDMPLGRTPLFASIPFAEGSYGKPTGLAELSLQKPGYQPLVVPLYATGDRSISLEPEGKPISRRYIFHMEQP